MKKAKNINTLLTVGDCHIISMITESADGCAVLAGEEVKIVGEVAVHIVQENWTTTLTKTVRKKFMHAWFSKSLSLVNWYFDRTLFCCLNT